MKCPNCNAKAIVDNVRTPRDIKYTIHRSYKCGCGFSFKSSEKIIFTTLPLKKRNEYLHEGRYGSENRY